MQARSRSPSRRPRLSPSSSVRPWATISPVAQDRHAVGEVLGLVHVVGGEEDRLAERLQPLDHVPGLAPRGRVEAGRRLVEEDQVGVADDPDRDVGAAFLAAGERADPGVALVAEPDQLDRLVDRPRARRRSRRRARPPRARSAAGRARTPAGPGRRACARRGSGWPGSTPSTETSPPSALAVALEDLDRRRLAGAVGAEEAEDLAGGDLEVDAAHRLAARRRTCAAR